MNGVATVRVAARALVRNKMRSFLTVLGLIIGVAAVIAMVAIGEGAKRRVESTFSSMGSNMLMILPGSSAAGGIRGGFGTQPTVTWEDLEALKREVRSVETAAAVLNTRAQVLGGDQNWSTSVTGTTNEYFVIRDWGAQSGSLFSESDVSNATKVAVLGHTVADKLFGPGRRPEGQTVRVNNVPFEVIGVLEKKGQSPMGQDYDDTVVVPLPTYLSRIHGGGEKYVMGAIMVKATAEAGTSRAESEARTLLRERHQLKQGEDDDFSIRNFTEMASAFAENTKTFTTLLAAIAAVSLLVGGIGIMNIMLVSVTERTREIGLRMAVGAKPRDILIQFLVEALTLSIAGGLLGSLLGVVGAEALALRFGWSVLIRPEIVALSIGFSAAVGVVFGLWPAQKAARLDPIEALRYE